ncbi:tyrosine-type recombinase/integrase [Corynebacterium sp.]|uniref:tyrosine-type recombinase/integrase n=1 Tax=Corynebacterium sp. TaxID=1720 RepID=UPI0026476F1D|nr:tyrosine-type recombinase/integrase [Corynebacterium sp.]MDN6136158.1 tyrosine-type recombinase/integrase [Corynebacterium sp.]MDN6737767.1 tyrosine-type recombinase/integrase [Corynebacterium sp.]
MTKTAAKTRLQPGEHSIDRTNPRPHNGGYVLDWSIRLNDGKLVRKRTQGATKSAVRARAKETAKNLLKAGKQHWTLNKPMNDYLTAETAQKIKESTRLKDASKARYLNALVLLKPKLKGYSIHDAMTFKVMEKVLKGIATEAPGSVSTARTVLSSYIADELVRAGVIAANPIRGVNLDLIPPKRRDQERRTLTEGEWDTVIKHLLTRDTTTLLTPTKHKNIRQSTKNIHARAVRLTLLQSITGLRISEANKLQWKHIINTDDGMLINASADIVKGRKGKEKGRYIPILRADVAEYLRQNRGQPEEYVVGSPADSFKPWDATNADDKIPELYKQIADETGVKILANLRSHSWRATLHGVYADVMDPATRAAIFGHTQAVAEEYYTDRNNIESLMRQVKQAYA